MKLSVCLITYNHERFIRQSLEGVFAQRVNFHWEVVIGEDCSPDATGAIVRECAARQPELVRVLDTPRNLGMMPNFLRTFAACTGEYVAMLEGDDSWTDAEKLVRQVELLDANPQLSFCFHPVAEVDADGKPGRITPTTSRVEFAFADLFPNNFIPTCSVVVRRSMLHPLPAWLISAMPGDWPLMLLAAARGPYRRLPQVMGAYRVHPGGVWSHRKVAERLALTIETLRTARQYFEPERANYFDRAIRLARFQRAWALADDDATQSRLELDALAADPAVRQQLGWRPFVALRARLRWPRLHAAAVRCRRCFASIS